MKIKRLFETPSMPMYMVIETPDGRYAKFFITPARKITEKDLQPVPYYRVIGKAAEEAKEYMYKMYGLTK